MDISGEYRIPAPRDAVWRGLNDPEVLRRAIPGCESLDKVSETEFHGTVVAKVGPVKAKFQGGVTLSDLDPPKGYVLTGEGKGAAAGFAKGAAKVELDEDGGETVLRYKVDAQVGGKLAQVGARLIDGTVKKLSGEFFQNFTNILAEQGAAAPAAAAAPEMAPPPEPPPVPGAAAPPAAGPAVPPTAGPAVAARPSEIVPPSAAAAGEAPPPPPPSAEPARPAPDAKGGLPPAVWVVGVVAIVALLLWIFAGN